MVVPAISMSSRAERVGQNWTDDSKRSSSSTAGHDQLGSAAQLLERLGVPQQGEHAVGDQVDRGLMPGEEQEQRVADDRLLGQAPLRAVVVDHRREHVRAGLLGGTGRSARPGTARSSATWARTAAARRCCSAVARLRAEVQPVQGCLDPAVEARVRPPAARPGPCRSRSPATGRRTRRRRRSGSCPSCSSSSPVTMRRISGSRSAIMCGTSGGPKMPHHPAAIHDRARAGPPVMIVAVERPARPPGLARPGASAAVIRADPRVVEQLRRSLGRC